LLETREGLREPASKAAQEFLEESRIPQRAKGWVLLHPAFAV